tara:strand:- start:45930 stop:46991 length:1062 start_codon:yes stop_codon:yes gene_type:complete
MKHLRNFKDFESLVTEKILTVKVGDEVIGNVDNSKTIGFNKFMTRLKSSVSSIALETFLPSYLLGKKLSGSELSFAESRIVQAYQNLPSPFQTDVLINTLKSGQIPINDLINSKDWLNEISSSFGGLPLEFILDIFNIYGKPGSAAIGKGEFMLLFFSELESAKSKDLQSKDGTIYEVKDNGNKDSGFRVGSQGKSAREAIKLLNTASPNFNYDIKLSFNAGTKGKGISLGKILLDATAATVLDYGKFAKSFLTFEKSYDKKVDDVTAKVLKANDLKLFRQYLGALQLWGYMKAEKIANVIFFNRKGNIPKNIGLIVYNKNFSTFFNSNKDNILVTGWENDGRNMSFRIKYIS